MHTHRPLDAHRFAYVTPAAQNLYRRTIWDRDPEKSDSIDYMGLVHKATGRQVEYLDLATGSIGDDSGMIGVDFFVHGTLDTPRDDGWPSTFTLAAILIQPIDCIVFFDPVREKSSDALKRFQIDCDQLFHPSLAVARCDGFDSTQDEVWDPVAHAVYDYGYSVRAQLHSFSSERGDGDIRYDGCVGPFVWDVFESGDVGILAGPGDAIYSTFAARDKDALRVEL